MDGSAEFGHVTPPPYTTHPRFRQIALIIYPCVLFAGIFDYAVGRPPTSILSFNPNTCLAIFCSAIILIFVLELIHQAQPSQEIISPAIHLILISFFSGIALTVSNVNYSQLLLLTPILFAELTFRRGVTLFTILFAVVIYFLRTTSEDPRIFFSTIDVQGLLFFSVLVLLIWLMARLIKSEWSNRLNAQRLNLELQESATQLAQMAVINERNRMARDIHDSVGHHLTAVSIQLEMAAKLHKRDPSASMAAIHEAQSVAHDALEDVRHSVGTLRHSAESFALEPAIELLISRIANEKLTINFHLDGDETLSSEPVRLVFFRAIQEGLTNIYKHATASHVNLWLQFLPEQARLRIIDDGVGFDSKQQTKGTGLQGVRERVEGLGGTVAIESRPNEGTILDIVLPQPA